MEKFRERLRELRIEKGLKQSELGTALNTTDDTIYSWEKGRSEPSIEMIVKICAFFEVTADYLLGIIDD
jgi:DNA-binding XRE family transcriptional regulator